MGDIVDNVHVSADLWNLLWLWSKGKYISCARGFSILTNTRQRHSADCDFSLRAWKQISQIM